MINLRVNNIYNTIFECINKKISNIYEFEIYNNNALDAAFNGITNTLLHIINIIDKNIIIENDIHDKDSNTKIFVLNNKFWYLSFISNCKIFVKKRNNNILLYCKYYYTHDDNSSDDTYYDAGDESESV